jgi:hypothetical protein
MSMPIWGSILMLSLASSAFAERMPTLAEKFPEGLLTEDYGIVTEEDLKLNAWLGKTSPFNPKESSGGFCRWQCFPAKEVTPKVRTWKDEDSMGFADVIVTMCDLEIWANKKEDTQVFASRRAYEVAFCEEFKKSWRRLIRDEKAVCISGEYTGLQQPNKSHPTQYKLWTWDKVKTRKGCYTYFGGASSDCEVSHWTKQGYPGLRRD